MTHDKRQMDRSRHLWNDMRGNRRLDTPADHDRASRALAGDAIAFRPSAEVLTKLGEPDNLGTSAGDVWEYHGKRLTPIPVRVGLADDGWTELLSGAIRPGDALVTSAWLRRGLRN
jgi:hypothetical protein